jgi:hypothetical protein
MADRTQLDALVKRRDALKATKDRLLGRLEGARADLAAVEDECRKRGVPPEKLDITIVELDRRYEAATKDLADRINAAEVDLKPFAEGAR